MMRAVLGSIDRGELHIRLVRELARRLLWFGPAYALFAGLYAIRPGLGGFAAWGLVVTLLVSGMLRSWFCWEILRDESPETAVVWGDRLTVAVAVQGGLLFLYLAQATWRVNGSFLDESLLVLGIAGMSSVTIGLFSPTPGSPGFTDWPNSSRSTPGDFSLPRALAGCCWSC